MGGVELMYNLQFIMYNCTASRMDVAVICESVPIMFTTAKLQLIFEIRKSCAKILFEMPRIIMNYADRMSLALYLLWEV